MKQYIDKSEVVREIEKRINENNKKAASYSSGSEHDYLYRIEEEVYEDLLSFLNTLEVKEVDLKKEIYDAEKKFGDIDEMGGYRILIFDDEFRDVLHHFFELGLKAQKEE